MQQFQAYSFELIKDIKAIKYYNLIIHSKSNKSVTVAMQNNITYGLLTLGIHFAKIIEGNSMNFTAAVIKLF